MEERESGVDEPRRQLAVPFLCIRVSRERGRGRGDPSRMDGGVERDPNRKYTRGCDVSFVLQHLPSTGSRVPFRRVA